MSNQPGSRDTDKGLAEIRLQIEAFSHLGIKAGIVEGSGSQDGVAIAQYAAWNEYGVPGKKKLWAIPPRPFIRGWVENNSEQIKATQERLFKRVSAGKMDAETAIKRLGEFARSGIKRYIREGNFTPNADTTIERKGSSQPLIDTGAMRNSVSYEIVRGGSK
ncbi:MAG: hypothetical protein LBD55_02570 [Treponema sp.]|jgi:hypothetical protein|nr:hypothetical protein [Treponema sp.]